MKNENFTYSQTAVKLRLFNLVKFLWATGDNSSNDPKSNVSNVSNSKRNKIFVSLVASGINLYQNKIELVAYTVARYAK